MASTTPSASALLLPPLPLPLLLLLLLLPFFVFATDGVPQPCVSAGSRSNVSGMYIFGDSLVDAGNNNLLVLNTYAHADFLPYGRDFPGGPNPTGRFANSYLIPDFLAKFLNLALPEPYLSPTSAITGNLDFASAGSGLYNTTGSIYVIIPSSAYPRPMSLQVQNFIQAKRRLAAATGAAAAERKIKNALFYITYGSNDIANNYYLENSALQKQYTIDEFIDILMNIYETQLRILYQNGARKFVVASLFPLGCSVLFLIHSNITTPGDCQEVFNMAALQFNTKLERVLGILRSSFPDAKFLFADSYTVPRDIVRNPVNYGFTVANVGCCNFIGPNNNRLVPLCLPGSPSCSNASQYVYWDQVHPTSRTYGILANMFWNGSTNSIRPLNVKQLAVL